MPGSTQSSAFMEQQRSTPQSHGATEKRRIFCGPGSANLLRKLIGLGRQHLPTQVRFMLNGTGKSKTGILDNMTSGFRSLRVRALYQRLTAAAIAVPPSSDQHLERLT